MNDTRWQDVAWGSEIVTPLVVCHDCGKSGNPKGMAAFRRNRIGLLIGGVRLNRRWGRHRLGPVVYYECITCFIAAVQRWGDYK